MRTIYNKTGIAEFDQAFAKLDNHLLLSGKSIRTRKSYLSKLILFVKEMKILPEHCNKHEIIQYLLQIKHRRNIGYALLKMHVYALRYYLLHIVERPDLFTKIPIPIQKTYNIQVLNIVEVKQLLIACRNVRERLILQLLYETGMRVSELVKLRLHDFDTYNKTITIYNSKNGVTRTVFFGNKLLSTLIEYNKQYKSLFSDCLFTRQFHPFIPMSSKGVSWILKRLVEKTNIKKRVNPHSFRHAFAVHYLNFGGTIYQLQKLLGHKNLVTTLSYLEYAILPESKNFSLLDKTIKMEKENVLQLSSAC